MTQCMSYRVTGRVQGVSFRAGAKAEAQRLGVTGYARNLPDGRVEVLACGEESAMRRFADWLRRGPPAARVSDVESEPVDVAAPTQFNIG